MIRKGLLLLLAIGMTVASLLFGSCTSGAASETGEGAVEGAAAEGEEDGGASDKVWTFRVADMDTPDACTIRAVKWYFDEVEKLADGRVKVEYYWADSLCPGNELIKAVRDKLAFAANIAAGFVPSELPLTPGMELGYITTNAAAHIRASNWMYLNYEPLRQTYFDAGLYPLWMPGNGSAGVVFARMPIRNLEELEGKKVRGYGRVVEGFDLMGATGVAVPWGDCYQAAQSGILDGIFSQWNAGWGMKFHEQAPYFIETGYGVYTNVAYAANLDTWRELPDDIQRVMTDLVPEAIEASIGNLVADNQPMVDDLVSSGCELYVWSEAEQTNSEKRVQPAQWNSWIEDVNELGYDGDAFKDRFLKKLAEFEEASTYDGPVLYWSEEYPDSVTHCD